MKRKKPDNSSGHSAQPNKTSNFIDLSSLDDNTQSEKFKNPSDYAIQLKQNNNSSNHSAQQKQTEKFVGSPNTLSNNSKNPVQNTNQRINSQQDSTFYNQQLFAAIKQRDEKKFIELIKPDIMWNLRYKDNYNILHMAIYYNLSYNVFYSLCQKLSGLLEDKNNYTGITPLHLAASKGCTNFFIAVANTVVSKEYFTKLLLIEDSLGNIPLGSAVINNQPKFITEVILSIITYSANIEYLKSILTQPVETTSAKDDFKFLNGSSLILMISIVCTPEFTKKLLSFFPNLVNTIIIDIFYANCRLHMACEKKASEEIKVIKLIIDNTGLDINKLYKGSDGEESSLVYLFTWSATSCGNNEVLKIILEKRASTNFISQNKSTALDLVDNFNKHYSQQIANMLKKPLNAYDKTALDKLQLLLANVQQTANMLKNYEARTFTELKALNLASTNYNIMPANQQLLLSINWLDDQKTMELINSGAVLRLKYQNNDNILGVLIDYSASIKTFEFACKKCPNLLADTNDLKVTPLHIAASKGYTSFFKAAANAVDKEYFTKLCFIKAPSGNIPLYSAVIQEKYKFISDAITFIIDNNKIELNYLKFMLVGLVVTAKDCFEFKPQFSFIGIKVFFAGKILLKNY